MRTGLRVLADFEAAVGRTPLMRLKAASVATGCDIFGKCEFLNPGGSVKDRAALSIIRDAEARAADDLLHGLHGDLGLRLHRCGRVRRRRLHRGFSACSRGTSAAVSHAQRTAMQRSTAVLSQRQSAPMGDSGRLTEAGGKNEL